MSLKFKIKCFLKTCNELFKTFLLHLKWIIFTQPIQVKFCFKLNNHHYNLVNYYKTAYKRVVLSLWIFDWVWNHPWFIWKFCTKYFIISKSLLYSARIGCIELEKCDLINRRTYSQRSNAVFFATYETFFNFKSVYGVGVIKEKKYIQLDNVV